MEQLIGDNMLPSKETEPITRQIDLMRVVARPYQQDGRGKVYWVATVGGRDYGPYELVDGLFKAVERDIHDNIGVGYRFGDPSY